MPLRLTTTACGGGVAWDGHFGGAAVTSPGADYDAEELSWLSRIIYALVGLCGLYMIKFYGPSVQES
ncbi:MAG: DUF378 domain-containing protein [Lachnospiraceae bacterium]|nr:DUF378 domain-containing protein [Lachnospiraceae bacterium]